MTDPVKLTATEAGRADKELARHFPDAGRRQLAELFDDGCVRVRGKRAKKGDRVEVAADAKEVLPNTMVSAILLEAV